MRMSCLMLTHVSFRLFFHAKHQFAAITDDKPLIGAQHMIEVHSSIGMPLIVCTLCKVRLSVELITKHLSMPLHWYRVLVRRPIVHYSVKIFVLITESGRPRGD